MVCLRHGRHASRPVVGLGVSTGAGEGFKLEGRGGKAPQQRLDVGDAIVHEGDIDFDSAKEEVSGFAGGRKQPSAFERKESMEPALAGLLFPEKRTFEHYHKS